MNGVDWTISGNLRFSPGQTSHQGLNSPYNFCEKKMATGLKCVVHVPKTVAQAKIILSCYNQN